MAAAAIAAIVVVTATAMVVAASAVVTATAASMGRLKLLGSSVTDEKHLALETYVLAGQRMVEIHLDVTVRDFKHLAVDTETVGSHHRHESTDFHHLVVKLAVDHKDVLG